MRLEGKVALITGGGVGIGAAITKKFVEEGAKVCIVGRRLEKLEETKAALPEGSVLVFQGDVSSHEDVKKMVTATVDFGGKVDVLVNNAGVETGGPVTELTLEEWNSIIAINLTGPFLTMKECIPHMIENGGGSIVNIGSLAAKRVLPFSPAYCTTKAALLHLSKAVANDYGPQGIRCNAVNPAAMITDMTRALVGPLAKTLGTDMTGGYNFFTQNLPLQRAADPSETANLCCFLASDEASFITGEDILVDGGAALVDPMGVALKGVM